MLMPIMAITVILIGSWAITLLIEAYVNASRKLDSESSKASPTAIRRTLSLWSFVLLLFTPSSLQSMTPVSRQGSNLGLTEQSKESDDETFCSSIG